MKPCLCPGFEYDSLSLILFILCGYVPNQKIKQTLWFKLTIFSGVVRTGSMSGSCILQWMHLEVLRNQFATCQDPSLASVALATAMGSTGRREHHFTINYVHSQKKHHVIFPALKISGIRLRIHCEKLANCK